MSDGYDMLGKPTKWPDEIQCNQDGCKEIAWMTEDQGGGFVGYECPVHGSFAVQFDDSDENFDEDEDDMDDLPFDDDEELDWDEDEE